MNDNLKRLTGKNPKDYEPVVYNLVNTPDVALFAELVSKEDFLFDFVKQNVAQRLAKVCNQSNYMNLLQFLKYYSPSYEEVIVSTLSKYADENLTDIMLELFENGTDYEKAYCAKFFSYVQDSLAVPCLKENAYSENSFLSSNCASTLALLGEETSYQEALKKLESNDEFVKLDGVKFLVSYGRVDCVEKIIETMKESSLAENMAGDLLYLTDLFSLYNSNKTNALFVANTIVNALGEILGLAQIFDFRLYEFFEMIINEPENSQISALLVNAIDKFDTLTENDEYLFDESKETKQEVLDIKMLLKSVDLAKMYEYIDSELKDDSLFVFTALEFTENEQAVRGLLFSKNTPVVLKALEVLKQIDSITQEDKTIAYESVSDENLRCIISAI